jgi:hypothetical protein
VPIRLTGTATRDDRGAQLAEEQEHHDHDQHEGLDQRAHHLVDRRVTNTVVS